MSSSIFSAVGFLIFVCGVLDFCSCVLFGAEMFPEVLWQCAAQLKLVSVLQLEALHNFGSKT